MINFYSNKRVVVCGGAGLVGAELVELLIGAGASVTVLDNLSRGKTRHTNALYIPEDAGVQRVCERVFYKADAVFNLAAYVAGAPYNQTHQAEMFRNNVRLQIAPVLAAVQVGVKHFLQVSSVCVYAPDKQNPCREENLGNEPDATNVGYAYAKRIGEQTALYSGLQHCIVVRPANVYGIRDYYDERAHVIPALIKKCLNDPIIRVNSTGQEVREFLYATDAARGMMIALEKGEPGAIYNIGSDGANSCTISELAYTLREILNVDKSIEFTGGGEGSRRIVNGDKLMRLGWQAEVSLQQGLRQVCQSALERFK